jgi:hypothetical protein
MPHFNRNAWGNFECWMMNVEWWMMNDEW